MELLSPAGEFDSALYSLKFGADAIYLADKNFGMRSASRNFDRTELEKITKFAHSLDSNGETKKVYVTLNILPTNNEIALIEEYVKFLDEIHIDGVIVADIGLLTLVKEIAPNLPIHISTQAGITNYQTANSLYNLGAKRVVLAREMSKEDIEDTIKNCNPNLEFEIFVHGSMCMAFSGRCFLSQYLNSRDANHGDCSQPCRWNYKVGELTGNIYEKTRPNMPIPIIEDENGTSILSAQDLNLIEHLQDLKEIGVDSIKIEGRAKSAYYSVIVTNSYRKVLDNLDNQKFVNEEKAYWVDQLNTVSHRPFSTGFFQSGKMGTKRIPPTQDYGEQYIRDYKFIGDVEKIDGREITVILRNRFKIGDELELIVPGQKKQNVTIENIQDSFGNKIGLVNKTLNKYSVTLDRNVNGEFGLLRRSV